MVNHSYLIVYYGVLQYIIVYYSNLIVYYGILQVFITEIIIMMQCKIENN